MLPFLPVYSDLLHLAWVTEVLSLLSLCEVILFLPGVTWKGTISKCHRCSKWKYLGLCSSLLEKNWCEQQLCPGVHVTLARTFRWPRFSFLVCSPISSPAWLYGGREVKHGKCVLNKCRTSLREGCISYPRLQVFHISSQQGGIVCAARVLGAPSHTLQAGDNSVHGLCVHLLGLLQQNPTS